MARGPFCLCPLGWGRWSWGSSLWAALSPPATTDPARRGRLWRSSCVWQETWLPGYRRSLEQDWDCRRPRQAAREKGVIAAVAGGALRGPDGAHVGGKVGEHRGRQEAGCPGQGTIAPWDADTSLADGRRHVLQSLHMGGAQDALAGRVPGRAARGHDRGPGGCAAGQPGLLGGRRRLRRAAGGAPGTLLGCG